MASVQTITCDAPGCGKDITQGDGRQWHIMLYSQVSGMKPGSTPRVDQGDVIPPKNFCDQHCVQTWAAADAAAADARQTAYVADLEAKATAAAAAAKAAQSPSPAPAPSNQPSE